jgi:hypothetical protein
MKQRTKNSRAPQPRRATHSNYFESLITVMRSDPSRFRLIRPETKLQLSVYLDLRRGTA